MFTVPICVSGNWLPETGLILTFYYVHISYDLFRIHAQRKVMVGQNEQPYAQWSCRRHGTHNLILTRQSNRIIVSGRRVRGTQTEKERCLCFKTRMYLKDMESFHAQQIFGTQAGSMGQLQKNIAPAFF